MLVMDLLFERANAYHQVQVFEPSKLYFNTRCRYCNVQYAQINMVEIYVLANETIIANILLAKYCLSHLQLAS